MNAPFKTSGEEASSSPDSVASGIKWTYKEVALGKSPTALAFSLSMVALIVFGYSLHQTVLESGAVSTATSVADSFVALKPQDLGEVIGVIFVMTLPFLALVHPLILLVMKLAYTWRDRNLAQTPENLKAHEIEAMKGWLWPLSMLVGAVDFTALYGIADMFATGLGQGDLLAQSPALSTLVAIACLVLAERRVCYLSQHMAAKLPGNRLTTCEVALGQADDQLPESMRNDYGRAKIACILSLGVVRSVTWATKIVNGITIRNKLKNFSGFLTAAIHGIATAITFGISASVVNSLSMVSIMCAEGRQEEYLQGVIAKKTTKPRFWPEVLCLIICFVYVTFNLFTSMI